MERQRHYVEWKRFWAKDPQHGSKIEDLREKSKRRVERRHQSCGLLKMDKVVGAREERAKGVSMHPAGKEKTHHKNWQIPASEILAGTSTFGTLDPLGGPCAFHFHCLMVNVDTV